MILKPPELRRRQIALKSIFEMVSKPEFDGDKKKNYKLPKVLDIT